MLAALLFFASAASFSSIAPEPGQSVQTRNGEFIFSKYPPRARAAGEQGSVRFQAEVDAGGLVLGCKVTEGSGHKRLDRETCDLIVNHATFKPTLDSDGKARAAVHDGIVHWRIPSAPSPEVRAKTASAATTEKVICKRSLKTGSLVAHSRLCLTARDWDRYAENNQDEWGGLQGRKGHTNASMPVWSVGQ